MWIGQIATLFTQLYLLLESKGNRRSVSAHKEPHAGAYWRRTWSMRPWGKWRVRTSGLTVMPAGNYNQPPQTRAKMKWLTRSSTDAKVDSQSLRYCTLCNIGTGLRPCHTLPDCRNGWKLNKVWWNRLMFVFCIVIVRCIHSVSSVVRQIFCFPI